MGSDAAPVCSAATLPRPDARNAARFLFAARAFPQIQALEMATPYVATYQIPLSPIGGESRLLALADRPPPGCQGWRITRVEGVDADGPLPAEQVRLHAHGSARGMVVVEKRFDPIPCGPNAADMHYPPCVFEMDPNDPLLAVAEAN